MFVDSLAGAWKHSVSSLHTMDDRGGAPTVAPPVDANPLFEQIAHAAAAGLEAYSGVESARVTIGGADPRPQVRFECWLSPSGQPAKVDTLIRSSLLGQVEILLGAQFTAVEVRIHPPSDHSAPRHGA